MKRSPDFQKWPTLLSIDLLRYNSKLFNIVTDWDGGTAFTIVVSDEKTKKVLEISEVKTIYYNFINAVDTEFNRLKTKWIFDYDNVLSASRSENAGAYHFSKSALFKSKVDS